MRPVIWFLLGFTLAVSSCSAFAANIKKMPLNGKSSVVNGRITPNGVGENPSTSYSRTVYEVGPADTGGDVTIYRNGLWDFTNKFGDKVSGTVIDAFKLNKVSMKDAFKATMKGGVYAIAGSLLLDYLIPKGIELMDNQLVKKDVNPDSPGWVSNNFSMSPKQYGIQMCSNGAPISMQGTSAVVKGFHVVSSTVEHTMIVDCYDNKTYSVAKMSLMNDPYFRSPLSAADVEIAINNFVDDKPADAVNDLKRLNYPFDIDTDRLGYSMQPSTVTTPERELSIETKTNPDGSTSTTNTSGKTSYEVKPNGEIDEQQQNKTTTTTTDAAGHTSTTTTNTTTHSSTSQQPPPEQKTLCEKTPDASACKQLGEPPDLEIPTDQVELSYSWSPFSMPASCPAPRMMNLSFGTVPLEFTLVCNFAEGIRPFVLAFAFLGALYICFGVSRRE